MNRRFPNYKKPINFIFLVFEKKILFFYSLNILLN